MSWNLFYLLIAFSFGTNKCLSTPSEDVDLRCFYTIPEVTCKTHIGELVVFDQVSGRCVIQNRGCSYQEVKDISFFSKTECEHICGAHSRSSSEVGTTDSPTDPRCHYSLPTENCGRTLLGDHFVFNKAESKCVKQTLGCSIEMLEKFEFPTFRECQLSCENDIAVNNEGIPPRSNGNAHHQLGSSSTDSRCSYRLPLPSCLVDIGEHYIFDSNEGKCAVQRNACSEQDDLSIYEFATLQECRDACEFLLG